MLRDWKKQYKLLTPLRDKLSNPKPRKLTSVIDREPSDVSNILIDHGWKKCTCHIPICKNGERCKQRSESVPQIKRDSLNNVQPADNSVQSQINSFVVQHAQDGNALR